MAGTWVFVEQRDGNIRKVTFEMLSEAKKFGDEVSAVVFGKGVEGLAPEFAKYGADKVYVADDDIFANYNTGAYVAQLVAMINENNPNAILFAHTFNGRDLASRLAQKLEIGLATDVVGVELSAGKGLFTRPIYAGKALSKVEITTGPILGTIRPGVFDVAEAAGAGEVVKPAVAASDADVYQTVKEFVPTVSARPELTEAEAVVSGGRGLKGPDGVKLIEDLADLLDAAIGGSRASIDSGWLGHELQVGQTGKVVNPNIYVAAGISGAIQHLAGMSSSKNIVSINTDPEAPIFNITDFGVVGDLFKVIPPLLDELKK
ncbi:Electron transfer flavoprotein, alpha subunit [Candidatus Syntrophocurvum alkaliphilum]|uniref:Electron transfer flavoprotein, alpha subunit n=1 Tax=Candidatus Syntrophocurvum alkaliphilum TaxID=2293317 RepID=A0A6I6DF18_9FIRM|nr:electron transfer flavoprotein subunit alpha/FixB family protein [Candidatus Syntrophocurvum alkaliphilum]QGT99061.1 Electron transfer flavoprotein, alpha subunit [Candidatus Syntrophocurvum alkaliphilum]